MKEVDSSSGLSFPKGLETPSFQKDMKDKQGELFINGPEYLRGSGFYGDSDRIYHFDQDQSGLCCSLEESAVGNTDKKRSNLNNNSELNDLSKQFSKDNDQSWRKNILEIDAPVPADLQHDSSTIQIQEEKNVLCPQIEFFPERSSLQSEHPFSSKEARIFNFRRIETEGRRHALTNDQSMIQPEITPNSVIQRTRSNYCYFLQHKQQQLRGFSEAVENCYRKKNTNTEKSEIARKIIHKVFQTSKRRQQRVETIKREVTNRLLDLSSVRKSTSLSIVQQHFIQDLSTGQKLNSQFQQSSSSFSTPFFSFELPQAIKNFLKFSLIAPTSTALVVWDFLQLVFTGLFLFLFSVLLFFAGEDSENDFVRLLEFLAVVLFFIDIIIQLNTTFYLKDRVVTSRRKIASRYCQSYLITDALSLLILIPQLISSEASLIYNPTHSLARYCTGSLVFLKLATMPQKIRRIEDYFALNDNQQLIRRLFSLVLFTMTAAHLASIVWHGLAVFEIKNGVSTNWMKKLNIQNDNYKIRYIYSLYWSVTTMCTIGYGDIVPTNEHEAMFAAISMVFLTCIFAYSINNIGMILQEIEKNSKHLRDQINTFQRFLDRKKVNIELKSRVRHYLRFLSEEQKDRNKEFEDSIFSKLSNKLREEVTASINSSIINQYELFSKLFSKKTIELMVFAMKEVLVSPNEIIFRDNCLDDQAVYFVQGGQIELFLNDIHKDGDSHLRIKLLEANDMFGKLSFFSGLSREVSARSLNLSTLYKITRNDFLQILKATTQDFEKFIMIQDQIILYQDVSAIETRCFSCSESGHTVINCPKIHKPFDRQFHSLKNNFSRDMERMPYKRKQVFQFVPWSQVQQNKGLFLKLLDNIEKFDTKTQLMLLPNDDEEDLIRQTTQFTSQETSNQSSSSDNESEDEVEEEEKLTEKEASKKSLFKPSSISEFKPSKDTKMVSLDSSFLQNGESNLCFNKKLSSFLQSESNQSKQLNFLNSLSKNISQQSILEQQQSDRPRIPFMSSQSSNALAHLNEKANMQIQDATENTDLYKSLHLDPLFMSLGENTLLSEKYCRGSSLKGEQSLKLFQNLRRQQTQRGSMTAIPQQNLDNIVSQPQMKGCLPNQRTNKLLEQTVKQQQQLQMSMSKFFQNSPYFVDIFNKARGKNSLNLAYSIEEDMESFESIKLFKYYFPHNNFDKIMHEFKTRKLEIISLTKKDRKKKKRLSPLNNREKQRRHNVFSIDVELLEKDCGIARAGTQQEQIQNEQVTALQYGVGAFRGKMCPKIFR